MIPTKVREYQSTMKLYCTEVFINFMRVLPQTAVFTPTTRGLKVIVLNSVSTTVTTHNSQGFKEPPM